MLGMLQLRSLLPIGLVLLGLFIGWGVTSLYFTAKIDRNAAMQAKEEARVAEATRQAHEKAVQKQNDIETAYLGKLKDAQRETARIATLLASGNYRLRLAGMPEIATDSSTATAGTARPDEEFGRAYIHHRDTIELIRENLGLCIRTLENDRGR